MIKGLIPMMGLFVFFGVVFLFIGGRTDSQAQSQFEKPSVWGNDVTISTGLAENGISVDCSAGDTLFAVRCTTWNAVENAGMIIYRSTNGGVAWSPFDTVFQLDTIFTFGGITYSYPVLLTGSVNRKLYLFYWISSNNGDIRMRSWNQDGTDEFAGAVKADADTITYFSACTDFGQGNYLMLAYQREEMGDATPDLYTIVSTDQGETWHNNVKITEDGVHPDIAYGNNGYVYLVCEKTAGTDHEIWFLRSNNYCDPSSWVFTVSLTSDTLDDTYPKVAALHSMPDSTRYIWVAYNQHDPGSADVDLRFAYSSNGGKDWSKNHILANAFDCREMACDLWVKRQVSSGRVNICYLRAKLGYPPYPPYIIYTWATSVEPVAWYSPININFYRPATHEDGRRVCQGTYFGHNCGIVYVGRDFPDGNDFEDIYFDSTALPTDVEEETEEGEVPTKFYLSANYPNPFNPVTTIRFKVEGQRSKVPIPTTLKVYNVLGQLVRTLVDEPKERGTYEVIWDGKDDEGKEVASGIYLYQLKVGEFAECKKMVLLK